MLQVSTNSDALIHGDRRIARLMSGDLLPGSLLLLTGESGTGKSVLCQQLTYNALYNSTRAVAYFTSQSQSYKLLDQMESFAFHVHYHFVADKFRVYPLSAINSTPSIDEAVGMLLNYLESLSPSFTLAIVDNINPLLANMDVETQVAAFREVQSLCKGSLRSVIMVTHPFVFPRNSLRRINTLCDYYLQTDVLPAPAGLEQMDTRTMRALHVRKICGVEMAAEPIMFEIRPGTGIHILPYVTVRA